MARAAIDAGHGRVQAAQGGRALEGEAVEMEGGAELVLPEARLRDQGEGEGRLGIAGEEVLEGLARQRLAGLAQVEPGGGIGGRELAQAAQVRLRGGMVAQAEQGLRQERPRAGIRGPEVHRLLQGHEGGGGLAQGQVRIAEEEGGGEGVGLQAKGRLERGDRVPLFPRQVQRHPEVDEQARVVGQGLHELAVEADRLRVAAGRHQLRAAAGLRGQLRPCGRGRALGRHEDEGKEERRHARSYPTEE